MEQLKCEMCGSIDFKKENGMYICQNCGCQYSTKELDNNKTVTVIKKTENISIEDYNSLKNTLLKARNALDSENYEDVKKYYNNVIQYDSQNIEAIFWEAFAEAALVADKRNLDSTKEKFDNIMKKVFIICDYYNPENFALFKPVIDQISDKIDYFLTDGGENLFVSIYFWIEFIFIEILEQIIQKDPQEFFYKTLIYHYADYIECFLVGDEKEYHKTKAIKLVKKVKEMDPFYTTDLDKYFDNECASRDENNSKKVDSQMIWLVTLLLCIFFGWGGAHRFFTGHIITGCIQLFTFGGYGIWWLYDLIMIICNKFETCDGDIISR